MRWSPRFASTRIKLNRCRALCRRPAALSPMITAGVSNVALARQLGTDEKTVRRLRDPLHQSRINQVDAALRVLGKRMGIVIEAA